VSAPSGASLFENLRFNALVIVPNALQGVFRPRRNAVAAATAANVDGQAIGLLAGMRRGHSGGPVWVRVVRDRALLLLTPADVHRALTDSPDPFASDPKPKKDGMSAFQPDALTISRGEAWRGRRAFTEAVLDTGGPLALGRMRRQQRESPVGVDRQRVPGREQPVRELGDGLRLCAGRSVSETADQAPLLRRADVIAEPGDEPRVARRGLAGHPVPLGHHLAERLG
jgi:hypothetical protein